MSRLIDEAYDLKTIDLEAIRDLLPAAITAGARAAAQIPKKHDLKANPSYKSSSSDPFGIGSHRDLLLLPTGVAYECEDAGDSWDRLFSYGKQARPTSAPGLAHICPEFLYACPAKGSRRAASPQGCICIRLRHIGARTGPHLRSD